VLSLLLIVINPLSSSKARAQVQSPPIRVTFAGDLMLDWSIKNTIKKYGVNYPFKQVKSEVSKSDIAVVNLETAVTTRTIKFPKTYNFKADPSSVTGITNAGFDLVALANNHSEDFRREGLIDTFNALNKYKLPYIGAGKSSAEAYRVKTFTVKGKRISFLAFTGIIPDRSWIAQSKQAGVANGKDLTTILNTIKRENAECDYLFVYLHWGVETSKKPEAYQRQWAKKMIDAGADGVVGSHSHVLQGFEYYKGKPIAYSIGNFLFPDYVKGEKAQTGLLHFDIQSNKIEMAFTPYHIYKDQIRVQDMKQKKNVWASLQSISFGVKIDNGKITQRK
jgi:poly-gamma-glutamate capsule biosynthesis protein CapA/YwtB (metallophosphatase superfamily)